MNQKVKMDLTVWFVVIVSSYNRGVCLTRTAKIIQVKVEICHRDI